MSGDSRHLTSGRRLARNVLWNLLGTGAPLIVAIVAIPLLIDGLGTERFGVLTLAWMVVGYFSLFDLGLGRALTKLVAEKLGGGQEDEIPSLTWTALILMAMLGILGAIAIAGISPWLVHSVLKIPADLLTETRTVFYLLAASIPIVISTAGLRGLLEAYQRFGLINTIRIFLGVIVFLGPLAVLAFSKSLVPVVALLVIVRLIVWIIYASVCLHTIPNLRNSVYVHRTMVKQLLSFGGWMTVTNIVGPIMVYMDRLFIGAIVSMSAVTYYSTPYEVVTKLLIIPGAVIGVLFPAFSSAYVQNRRRAADLFARAVKFVFIALFPLALSIVVFAYESLSFWLGHDFAAKSTSVLQLLAVGVFFNSLAYIPFGLVQGAGKPDYTAKLHILELPFYCILLWWSLGEYGIVGVAAAWVLRIAVDMVILFIIAERLLPCERSIMVTPMMLKVAGASTIILLGSLTQEIMFKWIFLTLSVILFIFIAWGFFLTEEDRELIRNRFGILERYP